MKRIIIAIAAVVAIFFALSGLEAQESGDERMSIYGYATSLASIDFRELPSEKAELGGLGYVRMKGDFKPQEGLSFHVEASYDARTGYQNPFAQLADAGLASAGAEGLVASIAVDQAYGSVVAGAFSLQAGKLPIGWGSAYVFNPTQRASRPALMDPVADETPGTLAILPTWAPADAFRLSGYVAFQDKSHRETAAAADGAIENLPFGLRAQTTIGSFDLAAGLVKEVDYVELPPLVAGGYHRGLYAFLDAAGGIGDVGVYAEAALRLPMGADLLEALEVAAGFDYLIPGIEVELRGEYYHQGSGTSDPALYSAVDLLSGRKLLQAEDYAFARAEKTIADYWKLSAGVLANLNDRGFVAMAELLFDAMENLELKLGGVLPYGPGGSEFEGRYDLSALGMGEIDVMRSSVYASCKVSF